MSNYYDYDPGEPYDPPPRRRRRRPSYKREGEYDDAWAAADDAEGEFGHVEIEGLAAGYHWEDDPQYGVYAPDERHQGDWRDRTPHDRTPEQHPNVRPHRPPANLGPLPNSVDRVRDRRPRQPQHLHATGDPHRSRTYHRDRARRIEYAEYYSPHTTPPPDVRRTVQHTSPGQPGIRGIPYWQILIVVVLSVFALLATALACASVLTL